MKKLSAVFIGSMISTAAFSINISATMINQLVQQYTPSALVGVEVADANTGNIIFKHNANIAFQPASNVKILTATAGLLYLGPNYSYTTSVYVDPTQLKDKHLKGNLVIKFSGDPSLSKNNLANLIKLTAQKIKSINGNVILDNTRFSVPYYSLGMIYEDQNWYYGSPATTIVLDKNYATFNLYPNKTIGKPASVQLLRNMQYMPMKYNVITVSNKEADHHCRLLVDIAKNNHVTLSGCWPLKGADPELDIAIKNPALFAAQFIQKELSKNNISFKGKIITGQKPQASNKLIAMHRSPFLVNLIHTMMKSSDNLYAQIITRSIGEKYYHVATIQEGANAIKQILKQQTKIDFQKSSDLYDGAGNRYNLLTPDQIIQVLYLAYHSPIKKDFINSLPQSGKNIDGTFRHQTIYSKFLPPNVYAKTGSMKGVVNLSGYFLTPNKRLLIFSIMINNYVGKGKKAYRLITALCQLLI